MTSEAPSKTRRHPRISLPKGMTAAWYGGGMQQVSRVQTLSSGGLSLSADITKPVGTSLMLVFEVPGGVVQAEAVVRNVVPGKEMGLEFTSMGSDARALLDDLLKRLLR
jgi:PilZ domain